MTTQKIAFFDTMYHSNGDDLALVTNVTMAEAQKCVFVYKSNFYQIARFYKSNSSADNYYIICTDGILLIKGSSYGIPPVCNPSDPDMINEFDPVELKSLRQQVANQPDMTIVPISKIVGYLEVGKRKLPLVTAAISSSDLLEKCVCFANINQEQKPIDDAREAAFICSDNQIVLMLSNQIDSNDLDYDYRFELMNEGSSFNARAENWQFTGKP